MARWVTLGEAGYPGRSNGLGTAGAVQSVSAQFAPRSRRPNKKINEAKGSKFKIKWNEKKGREKRNE